MGMLIQEIRFSLRMLMKTLGVSAIAVLTLGLGIGANTAIFTLLDQIMLRRLPVEKPDELVVLRSPGPMRGHASSDGDIAASFSFPMYKRLRETNEVFSGLLARYAIPLSVSAQGQTERASGELVSGNYFEVLGVNASLGRVFSLADDQQSGAHPVAVLSHAYWTRRFAQNPAVLNQPILINGHTLTVVGVARAGFTGVQVGQLPDVFIPLSMKAQMTPNWDGMLDWNDYWLAIIGRIKPGLSPEQASAGLQPSYAALLQEQLPTLKDWAKEKRDQFAAKKIVLQSGAQGRQILQSDAGAALWALFGMVVLVLLITCTNVANLLFVRGMGRQRELAIRLAMGARRGQLIRQLLIESLILSLLGGAFGLLIAIWISDALVKMVTGGELAQGLSSTPDARVLLFTFFISVLTGIVFGLIPAWRVTGGDMTPALKDQSAASSASRSQTRLRKFLVVAQVALTMLLLVGAGLLTRTLWNLRKVDLGIKPEQLITFSVAPELNGYSPEKAIALCNRLLQGLATVPGAQAVSMAEVSILTDNSSGSNVTPEGNAGDQNVNQNYVGPSFFSTMGAALLSGREFNLGDTSTSQKVAIINETAAQKLFPGRNPLGSRFAFGAGDDIRPDIEVVGIVKDNKHANVRDETRSFIYLPYSQNETLGQFSFYVRTKLDADTMAAALRRVVSAEDPNLPIYELKTMETVIGQNLVGERMVTILSLSFGALAALLAGVGLYGVLASWVVQRTREIGIRVALGAEPGAIRWMVLGQGVRMAVVGIAVGIAGGILGARLLESMLFGIRPADPITYAGATALLILIALLACYLPARRATRVDPMIALRCE